IEKLLDRAALGHVDGRRRPPVLEVGPVPLEPLQGRDPPGVVSPRPEVVAFPANSLTPLPVSVGGEGEIFRRLRWFRVDGFATIRHVVTCFLRGKVMIRPQPLQSVGVISTQDTDMAGGRKGGRVKKGEAKTINASP